MQVPGISRKMGLKCNSNKAFLQCINYLPFILNFALFEKSSNTNDKNAAKK